MKRIKEYINEKFQISVDSSMHKKQKKVTSYRQLTNIISKKLDNISADNTLLDLSDIDISALSDISDIFVDADSNNTLKFVEYIDVNNWDTTNLKSCKRLFRHMGNLKEVFGLEYWDTSNLENASAMFNGCKSLVRANLSSWNTKNLINADYMFNLCETITNLSCVNKWNTDKLVNARNMFSNCKNLTEINISHWTMAKNEGASLNAAFLDCKKLKSIGDLSEWEINENKFSCNDMLTGTQVKLSEKVERKLYNKIPW